MNLWYDAKMTYPMWLNPRSLAYISVMTVSSVWNLIKDSSYLYWHNLSASDWSTLVTSGLSLAHKWHLCAHCVTPGGAILNKIMTGLDWSQETFYLQFHSPHCLHARGQEDIRGHLGHWDRVQRKLLMMFGAVLMCPMFVDCSSQRLFPCHI